MMGNSAAGEALFALVIGFMAGGAVLWVIAGSLFGEPRRTAVSLGRWWAGWVGGGFMWVAAAQINLPMGEYLLRIVLTVPTTALIAFIAGVLWRRVSPVYDEQTEARSEVLHSPLPQGFPSPGEKKASVSMEEAYGAAYSPHVEQARVAAALPDSAVLTPSSPRTDDELYDAIAEEVETGRKVRGTWARAFADADGDENKALAIYIKLRVEALRQNRAAQCTVDGASPRFVP